MMKNVDQQHVKRATRMIVRLLCVVKSKDGVSSKELNERLRIVGIADKL